MLEAIVELKALRARYKAAGKLREAKAISRAIEVLQAACGQKSPSVEAGAA